VELDRRCYCGYCGGGERGPRFDESTAVWRHGHGWFSSEITSTLRPCQNVDRLNKVAARTISLKPKSQVFETCPHGRPRLLKCILNDMALDAGVKQLLHSWSTAAIVREHRQGGYFRK